MCTRLAFLVNYFLIFFATDIETINERIIMLKSEKQQNGVIRRCSFAREYWQIRSVSDVKTPLERQVMIELEDTEDRPSDSVVCTPMNLYMEKLDKSLEALPSLFSPHQLKCFLDQKKL